jgi:hypothetical protein
MSRSSPLLSLSTDTFDSPMFDDSAMGVRLAWVCLLLHTKAQGRAGKVRFRDKAFATQYRLNGESVAEMLRRATESSAITLQGDFVIVTNWKLYQDPKARVGADDDSSKEKVEKVEPAAEATEDSAFERFWKAFPSFRKHAKGKARVAFAKAAAKVDAEKIVTAAQEYAASEVGRGEFVKGPEPWLNGECWDDDRTAWKRSQGIGSSKPNRNDVDPSLFPE